MPPTGNAIMGGPHMRELFGIGIGAELIYAFIIIICSLMIYFGTKELYELSSYKGIKYFRLSFLFFAISYFFRSFIKFIIINFELNGIIDLSSQTFGITGFLTQIIFFYFSAMAIFFLLYSVMWKKWKKNNYVIYVLHAISLIFALISVIFRNPLTYLLLNLILLIIVIFVVYLSKNKKGHNSFIIYILLSAFWILNIIDVLIPNFLQGFQLIVYLASTFVFLLILYKVIKKTG